MREVLIGFAVINHEYCIRQAASENGSSRHVQMSTQEVAAAAAAYCCFFEGLTHGQSPN